jgi:hypothetical protein
MKPKFIILLLMIGIAAIITSCKKDNSTRPAVTTNQGGLKSAKVYSGTSDPSDTLGTIGDFYINLTTDLLFGPKTVSGWGTSVSLSQVGSFTGATNGATNGQLYNGSGPPSSTLGTVGDFYLDTAAYMLYGPKTAAGWGTPIAVQGPSTNTDVKTDVFSVSNTDWLWNSQYMYETAPGTFTEYFTRYYVRVNNTVTQNVLNNGMVLVYMQPSPADNPYQWAPLPYQFDLGFGYTYNYVYVTAIGQVTLMFYFIPTDSTATLPTLSTYVEDTREYKIVTVTGQTGTFMTTHHINLNKYRDVMKVTGLWANDKNSLK